MFLSKFKNNSIRRKLEKELRKADANGMLNEGRVTSVLVFVDENIDQNIIELLSKTLCVDSLRIDKVIFYNKLEKATGLDESITEKDFNWLGNLNSKSVKETVEKSYDLLLNYSSDSLFLNYLTAISNAKFKVGFTNADNRLYDFMIDVADNDITVFNSELKKYLKILNRI